MHRIEGALFLVLAASLCAHSLDVKKVQTATDSSNNVRTSIPKGAKTYSLFLICNPDWLGRDKQKDLGDLHDKFEAFGDSIGKENDAVWFWKRIPAHPRTARPKASDIDSDRNENFCAAWNLKPSDGPYVVITSVYPDEQHLSTTLNSAHAIISLGDSPQNKISEILKHLTEQLVLKPGQLGQTESSDSKPAEAVPPEAFWRRLLASAQAVIADIQASWTFSVDAGPVKAELKSPQKPTP
jgi:hypothetical protein